MATMETVRTLSVGRCTLKVTHEYDDNPDYSWLGRYCNLRDVRASEYVYDQAADAVRAPGSDIWRDRKGRIVHPDSESWRNSNAYRYIASSNVGRNKYMFADADRLSGLNGSDWYFIGIRARVIFAGWEIGEASVWGIESDSDKSYLASEARAVASDAVSEAQRSRKAMCKRSA